MRPAEYCEPHGLNTLFDILIVGSFLFSWEMARFIIIITIGIAFCLRVAPFKIKSVDETRELNGLVCPISLAVLRLIAADRFNPR